MGSSNLSNADKLAQRIKQAHALAHVMDTEDFESFSDQIKANYRWTLWTLLDEANEMISTHRLTVTGGGNQ